MNEKIIKQLPYGISDFETIRTGNYAYADKTRYIEMLENDSPYQFFVRPPKFGKSLFVSMLSQYYDVLRKDSFDKLFGGLYIGENPTPRKNRYAVMEFNFSGIDTSTPDNLRKSFVDKVQTSACRFLEKYQSIIPRAKALIGEISRNNYGNMSMEFLYSEVKAADVKLFIIIDDYDRFAEDVIATGGSEEMVREFNIVLNFYTILKNGTTDVVDRIFITGVTPIMINGLTSGFNIASYLSLARRYNNMMGFTAQEVDRLMDETGIYHADIKVDMAPGYLFDEDADDLIYNPSYFFNRIIQTTDNLNYDYAGLKRLTRNKNIQKRILRIIEEEEIYAQIPSSFPMTSLNAEKYFESMLFYMGWLTFEKSPDPIGRLCIPNESIKNVFREYQRKSI